MGVIALILIHMLTEGTVSLLNPLGMFLHLLKRIWSGIEPILIWSIKPTILLLGGYAVFAFFKKLYLLWNEADQWMKSIDATVKRVESYVIDYQYEVDRQNDHYSELKDDCFELKSHLISLEKFTGINEAAKAKKVEEQIVSTTNEGGINAFNQT
jgi:hypothetical protein